MDLIATLRPWAFVLLAIWLIMWAIKQYSTTAAGNSFYKGMMALLALVAGVLLLFSN